MTNTMAHENPATPKSRTVTELSMGLPLTVLTTVSVERSTPPGTDAVAPSARPFAAAVQALLRETYPLALISPRHELAALDGAQLWYAFRDGSAVPNVDRKTS
jgi:hypothetical protein